MLTQKQNDLLTQTNPGTPGGRLLRHYWQPVALSSDLPASGPPIPLRIMGEDLVLFRNDDGQPGLLALRCPHRKADLSYGRVENGGLRCVYHGWLFDVAGRCLEQPGEPGDSNYKDRIRHTAYPCVDVPGLILAYMGEGEPPALPPFPFFDTAKDHVWCNRSLHHCNYLQANEGNIDPQHLSFLHRVDMGAQVTYGSYLANDEAPAIDVEETPWGLRIQAGRGIGGGKRYIRYSNFVMPNGASFVGVPLVDPNESPPDSNDGYSLHWHVPVDDHSHIKFYLGYRQQGPIDARLQKKFVCDGQNDDYSFKRTLDNRFQQDRVEMREQTYAGIGANFQDHDRWVTESQGPIVDRTTENLGTTDRAIIMMRKQLLTAIDEMKAGRAPLFSHRSASAYQIDKFFTGSQIVETGTC